jgi:DNA invertase Pin-like site-specific DNA recombinase
LRFLREGDVLVVTKPDRLARSTRELLAIEEDLRKRGVGLVVQSMGLDTRGNGSNPTTRLQLTILAAVAQFERELMLERQREGIAKAKAAGKYRGRQPTVARQQARIRQLAKAGMGATEIARQLGIARSSVYRMLEIRGAGLAQLPSVTIKGNAKP